MSTNVTQARKESIEDIKVSASMNASLFYGPRDIRYELISTPRISDDEILVKVHTALTCGTDLKTFQRSHPKLIKSIPSTFGHQFSGTVVKVGKNVNNFYPNQRVVALNSAPCFKCTYCKSEQFSLCENIEFLNGAYARYVAIPERIVKFNTYEIPENITFEAAALVESISVVLHGLQKSELSEDKTLCVIGTGSIGLLFIALAKILYSNKIKIISVGRKEFKLQIAKDFGADYTVNLSKFPHTDEVEDYIKTLANGQGPDVVVEAVGVPKMWEFATSLVRCGGLVNFFGGCKKGEKVELDTYRLHYDELKLIGVFHHTPRCVQTALKLIKEGIIPSVVFQKIITCSLPLSELKNAFLMHEAGEAIQIAIRP